MFLKRMSEEDLQRYFEPVVVSRGYAYYTDDRVTQLNIAAAEGRRNVTLITANVRGRQAKNYTVDIEIGPVERTFDALCTCPVKMDCKHVVATLFAAIAQRRATIADTSEMDAATAALTRWFDTAQPTVDSSKVKTPYHLIYCLKRNIIKKNSIDVDLQCCRLLKKGGYGKPQPYSFTRASQQMHVQPVDDPILFGLQFLNRTTAPHHSVLSLSGAQSSHWLEKMVQTGRCFFETIKHAALTLGPTKPLRLYWNLLPNASQTLAMSVEQAELLVLDKVWYVDETNHQCGLVSTDMAPDVVKKLLHIPPVPPTMVQTTIDNLTSMLPISAHVFPQVLKSPLPKIGVEPIPQLHLNIETVRSPNYYEPDIECATMTISFDYDGSIIPFSMRKESAIITYHRDGVIYSTKRNHVKEKQYLFDLRTHIDFVAIPRHDDIEQWMILTLNNEDAFLQFSLYTLPQLAILGWRIIPEHDAFNTVIYEENVDWYSELDETSEYDYFGFKMGILLDGEKVNLLPIVAQLLSSNRIELNAYQDTDVVPLALPNGQVLSLPYARLKPIVMLLIELYDTTTIKHDALTLSKHQAALLIDMQQAIGAARLRWFGGEKVRALGKKLSEFDTIKFIATPTTFQGSLRGYQQAGVNWLQFLREYQLGGILADDMGLGKTVQTLAHLSIEKAAGRLQKPTLIIAPTSLMVNWRQEAERFTPNLSVLVFHGDTRHANQQTIKHHDIVLTTYPLLYRDKAVLLAQPYYYIILDEAQLIKNPKAKSTLIVQQLKAEHRLCMTGTPMENHLGELWSLFNFLMPGFLGDARQFKRLFRTPIEKRQDNVRRQGLALRIKPFILRRQKAAVLTELPDKTEICRTVELQGPERDVYESIRLAMEKKVRDAIRQKGLARSHIDLLDALLKLRQVCCHSRLLKLKMAQKAHHHSSKFALLQTMLPKLIEEGRKVLVFSQFTTMLGIMEEYLQQATLPYVKLTGATKNRAKPIEAFQQGKVPLFLISLKAGGTGLNLTAADTVIHYDPWWNPAVETQATDRAHRLGQTKSVFVYKLIAAGTVEETIQAMQDKKRALMTGLFSTQNSERLQLSADDLRHLFKPLEGAH